MVEKRHVRPTCFVLLSVQGKQLFSYKLNLYMLLSMGVDYVVIGFYMEVQPLVTHKAA